MILNISSLDKYYDNFHVLKDINLELEEGDIACLLGPSGCGKTTLLRCIAGFENIQEGEIHIRNQKVSDKNFSLSAENRKVGIVFQNYALFPHLDLIHNISFGLPHLSKIEAQHRSQKYLNLVGLGGMEKKYPHEISGGQQQRLAIARALAPEPNLLLMDEAFSNLDVELRQYLNQEIKNILKDLKVTTLMVSHNQEEAFDMADKIGIIHNGKLEQWDKAYNIYHEPKTEFVARFVGKGNFIEAQITATNCVNFGNVEICGNKNRNFSPGDKVKLLIRPDDVIHDDDSILKAKVLKKSFRGPYLLYDLLMASGDRLLSYVPSHHNHAIGEEIGIKFEVDHIVLFK